MPWVIYLCIALFTELFNLASSDVPVLITVSALVESQASADTTFPWSWIKKHKPLSLPTYCTKVKFFKKLRAGWKARKIGSFISAERSDNWVEIHYQMPHTALKHHWPAHYRSRLEINISYSLSSRRSVMSSSKEGKILLNILKSLPKRGIWIIRQEGA